MFSLQCFLNYSTGRPRPPGHLTNFCTNFYEFFNFRKFVKIRDFFCWGNEFSIYDYLPRLVLIYPIQRWRTLKYHSVRLQYAEHLLHAYVTSSRSPINCSLLWSCDTRGRIRPNVSFVEKCRLIKLFTHTNRDDHDGKADKEGQKMHENDVSSWRTARLPTNPVIQWQPGLTSLWRHTSWRNWITSYLASSACACFI